MFIDLAIDGKVEVLVSGDRKLFDIELGPEINSVIVTPAQYRKIDFER